MVTQLAGAVIGHVFRDGEKIGFLIGVTREYAAKYGGTPDDLIYELDAAGEEHLVESSCIVLPGDGIYLF